MFFPALVALGYTDAVLAVDEYLREPEYILTSEERRSVPIAEQHKIDIEKKIEAPTNSYFRNTKKKINVTRTEKFPPTSEIFVKKKDNVSRNEVLSSEVSNVQQQKNEIEDQDLKFENNFKNTFLEQENILKDILPGKEKETKRPTYQIQKERATKLLNNIGDTLSNVNEKYVNQPIYNGIDTIKNSVYNTLNNINEKPSEQPLSLAIGREPLPLKVVNVIDDVADKVGNITEKTIIGSSIIGTGAILAGKITNHIFEETKNSIEKEKDLLVRNFPMDLSDVIPDPTLSDHDKKANGQAPLEKLKNVEATTRQFLILYGHDDKKALKKIATTYSINDIAKILKKAEDGVIDYKTGEIHKLSQEAITFFKKPAAARVISSLFDAPGEKIKWSNGSKTAHIKDKGLPETLQMYEKDIAGKGLPHILKPDKSFNVYLDEAREIADRIGLDKSKIDKPSLDNLESKYKLALHQAVLGHELTSSDKSHLFAIGTFLKDNGRNVELEESNKNLQDAKTKLLFGDIKNAEEFGGYIKTIADLSKITGEDNTHLTNFALSHLGVNAINAQDAARGIPNAKPSLSFQDPETARYEVADLKSQIQTGKSLTPTPQVIRNSVLNPQERRENIKNIITEAEKKDTTSYEGGITNINKGSISDAVKERESSTLPQRVAVYKGDDKLYHVVRSMEEVPKGIQSRLIPIKELENNFIVDANSNPSAPTYTMRNPETEKEILNPHPTERERSELENGDVVMSGHEQPTKVNPTSDQIFDTTPVNFNIKPTIASSNLEDAIGKTFLADAAGVAGAALTNTLFGPSGAFIFSAAYNNLVKDLALQNTPYQAEAQKIYQSLKGSQVESLYENELLGGSRKRKLDNKDFLEGKTLPERAIRQRSEFNELGFEPSVLNPFATTSDFNSVGPIVADAFAQRRNTDLVRQTQEEYQQFYRHNAPYSVQSGQGLTARGFGVF